MKSGLRSFATIAAALFFLSVLGAGQTASPPATAKVDVAANSPLASGGRDAAQPPAATPAPLPAAAAPQASDTDSYTPRYEIFGGYSYFRAVPMSSSDNRLAWASGFSTSFAINANRYFGIVFDFGAYHANKFGPGAPPDGGVADASGNLFTYMVGPRLSWRHRRFTPFVQALFGEVDAKQVTLNSCSGSGCVPLPSESSYTFTAGGGLDITLSHHVALRLFQLEYANTRFMDPTASTGQTVSQNDARLSTGIVFRFGGERSASPPPPSNQPPALSCSADPSMVYAESGDAIAVHALANDPNGYPLTYSWTTTGGAVDGSGSDVHWNSAGVAPGAYTVQGQVDNGHGGTANCSAEVHVAPRPAGPLTMSCAVDPNSVIAGEHAQITATANSSDNNPLTYSWSASSGQITGAGASVDFDSTGLAPGSYTATGHVDNGNGATADCSVQLNVQAAAPVVLEAALALHSIYFPTDQPGAQSPNEGLVKSQQAILRTLATDFTLYLQSNSDAHLMLEGHADERASESYNEALAERRVALSKSFLVAQGVPEADIETKSFGKHQELDPAQVRRQMEANPNLTAEQRQALFANMQSVILAQNRRVDIVLVATGQKSVREYPFNAKDALTLLNDKSLMH